MPHTVAVRCLFINLASHDGLLACSDSQSVVASEPINHRIGDQELIPLLKKTLDVAGWKTQDLTHVACVTGPGGFMSLRVAVAFANTLIHRLRIFGGGIHLSDLFQIRASNQDFVWLHSTKKHELFVRGFGLFAALWPEATNLSTDVLLEQMPRNTAWAGELIPEHADLFRAKQPATVTLQPLADVLPVFLGHQKFSQNLLEPWYGREW